MLNQYREGDVLHGFRYTSSGVIPNMNASYVTFRHEKTGATLCVSDRDDGQLVFGVGFRTLPSDETGVFHIIEHSTLDGSEKYRVKEPFVTLMKTSMATDLNAVTYEDKTFYFFMSVNEKDYMNLMEVYLDSVFHPLVLKDRRIFEKEAWHLEPTADGGVAYSGVVFNEMQGTDNQPMRVMWQKLMACLFPDLCYAYNSGGNPACIPDLTYEDLCRTYRAFYRTDNATIYLAGPMDVEAKLAYLDGVLLNCDVPESDPPAPIAVQNPVICEDATAYYQIGENESTENNTKLTYAVVTGRGDNSYESTALNYVSRYLSETTESPLSAAVLSSGVGQDFSMGIETDCNMPFAVFELEKSDPENAGRFKTVITETLEKLCREGFDAEMMADIMASHETDCRRAALSVKTGYPIMETFMRAMAQTGKIVLTDDIAIIKQKVAENPRFFEELVERCILGSDHRTLLRVIPSRTLTVERQEKMAARLAAEAERIHAVPGEYEKLVAYNETFNAYLTAPDDPEAERLIPKLSVSDIRPDLPGSDVEKKEIFIGQKKCVSLSYPAKTEGMADARLLFDLSCIDDDDLFYVRALADSMLYLPAGDMDVNTLTAKWLSIRTNPNASYSNYIRDTSENGYFACLKLSLDVPGEYLSRALELLGTYMAAPVFDKDILRRIFSNASGIKDGMVARGHNVALNLAQAQLSPAHARNEQVTGLTSYRKIVRLVDHFDEEIDGLIEGMTRVARTLFDKVAPIAFITGEESAIAEWETALGKLPLPADTLTAGDRKTVKTAPRCNRALTVPGEVNYCDLVMKLADCGMTFNHNMRVITAYIGNIYFWDEIRAKGGAYGGFAAALPQGVIGLLSYRDPRVSDTYRVYDGLTAWMREHIPSQEDINSLIVSTMPTYFSPESPLDKGANALSRYVCGYTMDDIRAGLAQVLSTCPDDFIAFADMLDTLMKNGNCVRTALGSRTMITGSGLFESVEEL